MTVCPRKLSSDCVVSLCLPFEGRTEMRVGIIGDTHGSYDGIHAAIDVAGEVDCWLHTGDQYLDSIFLAKITRLPVVAVRGNGDWRMQSGLYDEYIQIGDAVILLTHGHRYGVEYGPQQLIEHAREKGVDAVVFGHTHRPLNITDEGISVFNPGSPTRPRQRNGQPTFGIMTIKPKEIIFEIFMLTKE